jgi:perosamine synthetase
MNVVRLQAPTVEGQRAHFAWTVSPPSALYRRNEFFLSFPASIDLRAVPESIWWRVALICLHSHWTLLRPCAVELPVGLAPAEREFWLRLLDAEVATVEAYGGSSDTQRAIELLDSGPPMPALSPVPDNGGVVACFSGGRDSLTQTGMLCELGERPLLVATTAPIINSHDHEARRRREVMAEIVRRRPVELIEVTSDLRSAWDNQFPTERFGVGVHEITDAFLYFAGALVVAAARGVHHVFLASEAEVQETVRRAGQIVQHKHFMYSAVTQQALRALLAPTGIRYGSLTYPLFQFHVQRLLSERYGDLQDLQFSCWKVEPEQTACSSCNECWTIALNLMASGVSPAEAGIEIVELIGAMADWRPRFDPAGDDYRGGDPSTPSEGVARTLDTQSLRCLRALDAERLAAFVGEREQPAAREAMRAYAALRDRSLSYRVDPEPGYRAGLLELLDERVRTRLTAIFDEHFQRAPATEDERALQRTRTLTGWIAQPLQGTPAASEVPRGGVASDPYRPPIARPLEPVTPGEDELAAIRHLIPGDEPRLMQPQPLDGLPIPERIVPVADTRLDGNELRYVSECVQANWVSSTGAFVGRFEEEFAAAVQARFGVACSSGTAALHLALAASGIGAGDEVLIPTFTMIATANTVGYVGATPVLVDSDPETWNLDVERLADSLSARTRAIVVVHTYGSPCEMDAINEFAERNGLVVIEDAAEAHGALYRGRPVGGLANVGAFSFYGNKILTTGEGGMLTTDDERVAEAARKLRDHGFSGRTHFWHRHAAFNYRISNLQAAVGLAQTERLAELVGLHRHIDTRYRERLEGIPGLELPPCPEQSESACWVFGMRVGEQFGCSRDQLRNRLAACGVETRTFFVPMHLQPIYRSRFAGQRFPVAEQLGSTGLYLPSGPLLSDAEIDYVSAQVRAAAGAAGVPQVDVPQEEIPTRA